MKIDCNVFISNSSYLNIHKKNCSRDMRIFVNLKYRNFILVY